MMGFLDISMMGFLDKYDGFPWQIWMGFLDKYNGFPWYIWWVSL